MKKMIRASINDMNGFGSHIDTTDNYMFFMWLQEWVQRYGVNAITAQYRDRCSRTAD